jgi:hypothetical protein
MRVDEKIFESEVNLPAILMSFTVSLLFFLFFINVF